MSYPILEFDPERVARLEPEQISKRIDIPKPAVLCFFSEVIAQLVQKRCAKKIAQQRTVMGSHPVYEIEFRSRRVAVFHPGAGAPLAAAFLEELIARGCNKFVACGAAGVLNSAIAAGEILVPAAAVRDEGTSYHYLPPAREIAAPEIAVAAIESTLKKHACAFRSIKTWTTDAIYRETPARIERRRNEGCSAVEMEAAALFAVAAFRQVELGILLYAADDLAGPTWRSRGWTRLYEIREQLFWLSVESCLAI